MPRIHGVKAKSHCVYYNSPHQLQQQNKRGRNHQFCSFQHLVSAAEQIPGGIGSKADWTGRRLTTLKRNLLLIKWLIITTISVGYLQTLYYINGNQSEHQSTDAYRCPSHAAYRSCFFTGFIDRAPNSMKKYVDHQPKCFADPSTLRLNVGNILCRFIRPTKHRESAATPNI